MDISYALWGLLGAIVYAATRLIAALYSGDKPPEPRRARRAWLQFGLAVVTGPIAAAGFTASIVAWSWLRGVIRPEAVALTIGLSSNTLWPILVDGIVRRGRLMSGEIDP